MPQTKIPHGQARKCENTPRTVRLSKPTKISLLGIMRQNDRSSLFERPLRWTDLHVRLLGVQFSELAPSDKPHPARTVPGSSPSKGTLYPSTTIQTLSESLSRILVPVENTTIAASPLEEAAIANAVNTAMSTLWPDAFQFAKTHLKMPIYFNGRAYDKAIDMMVAWNAPGPGQSNSRSGKLICTRLQAGKGKSTRGADAPNLPTICYVGKDQLADMRRKLFRIRSPLQGFANEPVERLRELCIGKLAPANSDQDAYMGGLFLAMAQAHFYKTHEQLVANGESGQPDFQDIKLRILSHDSCTEEFIVYTCVVTAGFLDRFHSPRHTPKAPDGNTVPGLDIQYVKVPIWPILGLRERIGLALGDFVGLFDPAIMERWDADEDNRKIKRKHGNMWEASDAKRTSADNEIGEPNKKRQNYLTAPP